MPVAAISSAAGVEVALFPYGDSAFAWHSSIVIATTLYDCIAIRAYPLVAPADIPAMMFFCRTMYASITGTITRVTAASSVGKSVS